MKTDDRCYLCGSYKDLTRDHVPPKCLFPKPRPSDLLTLPCCYECNNSASDDDEYLRLATSGLLNANSTGALAWKRAVEGTIRRRRLGAVLDDFLAKAKPVILSSAVEISPATQFSIDADSIFRSLVKISKGILAVSHPEVDSRSLDFYVTHIDQFKTDAVILSGIADTFPLYEVGDGVYMNWRGVSQDDPHQGFILHMFYGAAVWLVQHRPGGGRVEVYGADPEW